VLAICAAIYRVLSRISCARYSLYNEDASESHGRRTSLIPNPCGAIAQLGERIVRNDEVVGSIPTSSTNNSLEINAR
jgi:hypothetical protein